MVQVRRILGLRGPADVVQGIVSVIPPIGIQLSFPDVSAEWDPRAPAAPAQASGSTIGQWATSHIFRPVVSVGGQPINNYDGVPDYSTAARFFAWLAGAGAAGGTLWLLVRALYPTGRRA